MWETILPRSRSTTERARADDALGQRAEARREFTRTIDLLANSPIILDRKLVATARR
jgi:hypothetical protein